MRRVLAAATNLASISGTLYDDINFNDQVDAGEPRLASAQVQLIDQAGNIATVSASTDAEGVYVFPAVTAGNYVVRQPVQTLSGGRQLIEKTSPTIAITTDDVTGVLSTQIDSFDTTAQLVSDDTLDGQPVFSQILASEAIGGQRDLIVNNTSTSGVVQLSVDRDLDTIAFDSITGGDGERRIIWDGIDSDPANVDDTGLGSVDLTQGGGLGFNLVMGTDVAGSTATIRIYSNDSNPATAGRYSTATIPIPVTTPLPSGRLETIPEYISFAGSFSAVGGGADFGDVSAIELEIDATSTTNGIAELIGAFAPTEFTANFDNFDEAELALTKIVDNAAPNVGDTVNYTIAVTNNGPTNATGVQVTDQLPTGIRFLMASAGNNYDASTGIWTVGSLAVGAASTATLTLSGQVESVGSKNNVATITHSDQTDANTANNVASANVTPQQIDLEVAKSVDNNLPNVGDAVTFTIVTSNTQSQTATGVQVRDLIPTGLRIASPSDVTVTTGVYNTFNGVWDVGTITGNTSETMTIRAIVDSTGSFTNVAEVIAANEADFDSIPGDGMGDDFASVNLSTAAADLELIKTVDNAAPNLNSNVNFTVTVTNAGPNVATNVSVLDQLPQGMTFLQSSDPAAYNSSNGIWTIGTLAANSNASLTILASVDQVGVKINSARVETSDQADPDSTPGNDAIGEDDQQEVQVTPMAADLSLTKSVNNLAPDTGDTVRFQITVTNSGPSTATGVQVRDRLPEGTQFVNASFAPGSGYTDPPDFNPTTGIWRIPSIQVGTPVTLNLDTLVTGTGLQSNVAQVIASDQPDPDSTPGNNDPGEDDQDNAGFRPRLIDLSLTKSVDNFSPSVGDQIEWVVTVLNTGDDVATGVQVSEQLPAGVTAVTVIASRGSFNQTTGVWNIGTVGINDPVTLTIRTSVDQIGMGTNRAEVIAADQQDIDSTPNNGVTTEDDYASVAFTTETADLSLDKVVFGSDRPNAGDQISFDITVINSGPDNASGVQITDLLPTGLTYLSNNVSGGIYNPSSGVWTIGDLPAPTERQTLLIGPEIYTASSGTMLFTQQTSPARYESPIANFQSDPLGETSNALVALGWIPSQFQLRQVSVDGNPTGLNVEIRFLGEALSGIDIPRINLVGNLNVAVNTQTIQESPVGVNSFVTLRINAIVDTTNVITNIAEVTASDQTDPDSTPAGGADDEDDRATATLTPQSIDLSLTKTASIDKPNPGDEVTFTLAVSNSGQDPATGVEVTDEFPAGLTFVRSVPSGVYDPSTGVWTVGGVEVDQTVTLEIVATADSEVAETNNAEVTAADQRDVDSTPGNGDPNEDDIAGATVSPATADLSITKTVNDDSPNVGAEVEFTIVIANAGPDVATGIRVRDQIPAGMTFNSATVSSGVYDPGSGVWSVETIGVGSEVTLTITADVDSVDDKTNVAELIASDQFDPDSRPANNEPDEDDQDSASLSPELIDLALSLSVNNARPNIGDVVRFEIGLTNEGPTGASGVTVLDQLPAGLNFQAAIANLGSYDPNTGIWNVGSIAVGDTPTLLIDAVVQAVDSSENSAQVQTADQPDSDSQPGNSDPGEDDQASVTVKTQVADLSLIKAVDNSTPGRVGDIQFIVRVTNAGPDPATEVVVKDMLPPGLRLVSADPTIGTYDAETGLWEIDSIDNGQFAQLRLVAAVTSAEPSTNVAEVIQALQIDPDSTPGNGDPEEDDIASAAVTPRVVDIAVSGTIDNDSPLEGETIQIAFTVLNEGGGDGTGIEFDAPLPDGLTLISSQPQTGTYDSSTGQWIVGDLAAGQATRLVLNLRIDQRGIKHVVIEQVAGNEFDVDSTPGNGIESEDDQTSVLVKAPRLLQKRLFLSR